MIGTQGKTAVRGTTAPLRLAIVYRDVLAVLQSDAARTEALTRYRASGHTADGFDRPAARRAMVEALVATEDVLELRGVRVEREAIRAVRRRLECEVES